MMKQDRLAHCIGHIDGKYIEEAESYQKTNKRIWRVWGSVVACLCLLVVGAYTAFHPSPLDEAGNRILQWSPQFSAEDYFQYSDGENGGPLDFFSIAEAHYPYTESRSFSHKRQQLEAEKVLPVMAEHPLFDCTVNYLADGSLYSLTFSWHNQEQEYSDLRITAGYQEVEMMEDCVVFVDEDENGHRIAPAVTVTKRDGVNIVAEGSENTKKTITFQNSSGWYQIEGSWNDRYADMVDLLDWFWAHPIDFDRFPVEAGEVITDL